MEDKINNLLNIINADRKSKSTGFVIGNTSDLFNDSELYFTPLRETGNLIYAGVVVKDVCTALRAIELIDGKVDYIFVDSEKKIRKVYYGRDDYGDIEKAIKEKALKSNIATYKGNDLGAEAIYLLTERLSKGLGNMRVAVIGAGNLGSKVALKMIESGRETAVFRRDADKLKIIVDGLNNIKTESMLASASAAKSIADAIGGADVVIACANEKGIITKDCFGLMNVRGPRIIIDAGKGCFDEDFIKAAELQNINIYRTDVSIIQKNFFSAIIETDNIYSKPLGRKKLSNEITLVSLGLLGKYGEIIVDDISAPQKIIGISDGKGSLLADAASF